jgi:hypothetical protein
MEVVDLKLNFHSELWYQCMDLIRSSDDALRDNYLTINFDDFLSFPAVINNDRIVCFSGLQYSEKKWGRGIARASSRMWIHPAYRHTGMVKFTGGSKFLNTTHCLPVQFKAALNANINCLFISRESNPKAFEQYLRLVEINCQYKFTLLDRYYNVCGPQATVPPSCRQYVAVHYLNNAGSGTWHLNMHQHSLMSI